MRIPPSFYNFAGRFLLFAAIEVACVLLVVNNGIVQQYTIVEKLRTLQGFFWNTESNIQKYTHLRKINADVTAQNKHLVEENEKLRNYINSIKGANIADSLVLNLKDSTFAYDWATVIKNKFNSSHNYIIINKGRIHGIEPDMGVITPHGVVGIIRAVGQKHAYILSSLNREQQISAKIGKEGTIGPLTWDGNNAQYSTLNEIPQHIAISAGDTIYTSGYSSFFPADIPLGVAESSTIVNGIHRSIKVKLFQDFSLLDNVIIVKNRNFNEIDSLSTF